MDPLDVLQRLIDIIIVFVIAAPIYKACKASLLEDLEQRRKKREDKKNG